jgi:hypothetical protein
MQHKIFCVREFIKTESANSVQRAFRLPPLGESSSGGIWKFRTSSFKCYVDHSHTVYSSGNIDLRNWVHLFESPCISSFWGIINVTCLLLPAVPVCLSLDLLKPLWWLDEFNKIQITQNTSHGISYHWWKFWSQTIRISSWDYFPQVPNHHDFQIVCSQIKGILLCCG